MTITPKITSIRYSSAPVRKNPKAGDERFLKGRGITQIRQQCGHWIWRHDEEGSRQRLAMVVSNGRPVWEWVDKGSARDRTSEAWREAQRAEQ